MLELRLLGPVGLWSGGVEVDLGPAKQRTVLAALALSHNSVLSTHALIERVWGERPPSRARDVLYTYVSRLRSALRCGIPATLCHSEFGYALEIDRDRVDAHQFDRLVATAIGHDRRPEASVPLLRQGLRLWRGQALTGVHGDWVDRTRERFHRQRLGVQVACLDGELRLGRHAEVVNEISELLVAHPTAEPLVAQLMLALYRSGRTTEALRVFHDARHALVDIDGLDPGPHLCAMYKAILGNDPALLQDPDRAPALARVIQGAR